MALFKDIIKLVGVTIKLDALRQEIKVPVEREVFANKRSVSQSEFFNAGQNGLKPQYLFEVRLTEYAGEDQLIYNGTHYSIYRTYEKGENIELYCEVRVRGH